MEHINNHYTPDLIDEILEEYSILPVKIESIELLLKKVNEARFLLDEVNLFLLTDEKSSFVTKNINEDIIEIEDPIIDELLWEKISNFERRIKFNEILQISKDAKKLLKILWNKKIDFVEYLISIGKSANFILSKSDLVGIYTCGKEFEKLEDEEEETENLIKNLFFLEKLMRKLNDEEIKVAKSILKDVSLKHKLKDKTTIFCKLFDFSEEIKSLTDKNEIELLNHIAKLENTGIWHFFQNNFKNNITTTEEEEEKAINEKNLAITNTKTFKSMFKKEGKEVGRKGRKPGLSNLDATINLNEVAFLFFT